MSKETLTFVLGLVVFLSPFLGIPGNYKKWLLVGCGLVLMTIGYHARRNAFLKSFHHSEAERRSDAFVEHTGVDTSSTTMRDSGLLS